VRRLKLAIVRWLILRAYTSPVWRGVIEGAYEGLTGEPLKLPRRRRSTPWSFRRRS
jgi:hypothetical protein